MAAWWGTAAVTLSLCPCNHGLHNYFPCSRWGVHMGFDPKPAGACVFALYVKKNKTPTTELFFSDCSFWMFCGCTVTFLTRTTRWILAKLGVIMGNGCRKSPSNTGEMAQLSLLGGGVHSIQYHSTCRKMFSGVRGDKIPSRASSVLQGGAQMHPIMHWVTGRVGLEGYLMHLRAKHTLIPSKCFDLWGYRLLFNTLS